MFTNLTYKVKFFILIGVTILLSIVSYKMSFKKMLDTKKTIREVDAKLEKVSSADVDVDILTQKISFLDKQIGSTTDVELVPHLLIDFISTFSKVKIFKIKEVHHATDNNFNIYTNQIVLQGNYNDLMSVLFAIEKEVSDSRIVNVEFYKEKDHRVRKHKLYLKLTFQNYEKNN